MLFALKYKFFGFSYNSKTPRKVLDKVPFGEFS